MRTQSQHELTRKLRAHSLVKCRVSCALCWSWFSRCHWCRTSHRSVSPRTRCEEVGVVKRVHLLSSEERRVATAFKVVEEVQEEVQEVKDE